MRLSQYFLPLIKEPPSEAQIASHIRPNLEDRVVGRHSELRVHLTIVDAEDSNIDVVGFCEPPPSNESANIRQAHSSYPPPSSANASRESR